MDGEEGDRLRRVMQPLFVTIAMKDALSVLLRRQLARLRNMSTDDGGKADHPFDPHVLPADLRKLDSLNYAPDRESHPPLSNKSQADISQDRSQGQDSSRLQHPSIIPTLHRLLLPAFGPGSDLHIAFLAFKWRLSDCYARDSPTPRRGSFFVSGPVAIQGRTGSCRVEVKAEYHPATSSWSKVSMQLKDIHLHKQIALGGRSDLP